MCAIAFLHTVPQDRLEAAPVGDVVGAGKRRLGLGLREAFRIVAFCSFGVGLMAGLMALRMWALMPASFHFQG